MWHRNQKFCKPVVLKLENIIYKFSSYLDGIWTISNTLYKQLNCSFFFKLASQIDIIHAITNTTLHADLRCRPSFSRWWFGGDYFNIFVVFWWYIDAFKHALQAAELFFFFQNCSSKSYYTREYEQKNIFDSKWYIPGDSDQNSVK